MPPCNDPQGATMTETLRVLGISGSLRKDSWNTLLLRAAQKLAPAGMAIEIASIRELPFYDGDVEAAGLPASVAAFR
jgi:chromate reductase